MATLPYEQRVTLHDANKAYYGNGQPAPQGVTLHDASKAAYPHTNFLDWFLTGDTGIGYKHLLELFRDKRNPNVPSAIPSYIPQDQVDTDSRLPSHIPQLIEANDQLPSHIPQYNPHAELPYLIAESSESPYYKVDAYNRPVLKPAVPSDSEIVNNIIRGKYGNGAARNQALTSLGLSADDIGRIRGLVNARMYASRAAVKPRVAAPAPAPAPQPQQRTYYQGMPMNGYWSVQDIM
jgi:hypothetical protein